MSPVGDRISFLGAHFVERLLSSASDIIVCVSEEEMEHARTLGIPQSKLRQIPNGISLRKAQEARSQRALVRREMNLSDADVCIGAVGRLVEQKAFHVLIEAFALAAPQLTQNVKLVMIGDGPLLSQLQTVAKKLSIEERVMFKGKLPGLRTMAAFDIFAMSSCCEGHPYTLIEALSIGLPIVTTAIGGTKTSVLPGVNGFVSQIGDSKSMATNLVTLAHSPGLRQQMAAASLRMATQFSLENMLRLTAEVYDEQVKTTSYTAQAAGAGR
jgi:glycosyltransferase involved in cell wall biosynthesis